MRREGAGRRRTGLHARLQIAAEAARILAEQGIRDYRLAKSKAAERLAAGDPTELPTNEEVERALEEHLRIFQPQKLAERTHRYRRIAGDAIRFFEKFQPRAVGCVLSGTITEHDGVQLHLCADSPEQVALALMSHEIPYDQAHRRLRFGRDRYQDIPAYRFTAEGIAIELVVFSPAEFREPPLSPVDGKPMKRATLRDLKCLLDAAGPATSANTSSAT